MHSELPSIGPLLEEMVRVQASDLYLTVGVPPAMRVGDNVTPFSAFPALDGASIAGFLETLLSDDAREEFASTLEYNTAFTWPSAGRFRLNVFKQQQQTGMVIRRIRSDIPTIDELGLPEPYRQMMMEKRGMILVVGPTGSGKTTSLAAMIGHRNTHGQGHIVTIEDPIEFIHTHQGCIVTQRDIGIDTFSIGLALKNALRQRPDVVMIGEIRDSETMEHAITFAETGHLCLATLHANNAYQTIDRILNFFPEEKHKQVLQYLAVNLRAIFSQRLITNKQGGKTLAMEILLNRGLIRSLIEENKIKDIKEMIERNRSEGMMSFDQCLVELCQKGVITEEIALSECDNPANVRLHLTQLTTERKLQAMKSFSPAANPASNTAVF